MTNAENLSGAAAAAVQKKAVGSSFYLAMRLMPREERDAMFAIYALPIGLLCAGPVIKEVGYSGTAALYCAIGIALTLLVAYRWRADLWSKTALANVR